MSGVVRNNGYTAKNWWKLLANATRRGIFWMGQHVGKWQRGIFTHAMTSNICQEVCEGFKIWIVHYRFSPKIEFFPALVEVSRSFVELTFWLVHNVCRTEYSNTRDHTTVLYRILILCPDLFIMTLAWFRTWPSFDAVFKCTDPKSAVQSFEQTISENSLLKCAFEPGQQWKDF